jgi:predicted HTH domain antitoxin
VLEILMPGDPSESAMAAVTIDLPEGAFNGLGDSPERFVQELRLAAAIFWYSRGEISQGKGAQIAGLSRREFIEALGRAHVDAIQIDDEDLKDEVERDLQARRFGRDKPRDLRYHAAQEAGTAR